jgi:hypothetical protein
MADASPLSAVAFGTFKFLNAAHEHVRDEIARLRQENEALRREVGARRHWIEISRMPTIHSIGR